MSVFRNYRLKRLNVIRAKLEAEIQQLTIAEKQYGSSYYTDRLIEAVGLHAVIRLKLECLQDKQPLT